jgi:hypothetical protein
MEEKQEFSESKKWCKKRNSRELNLCSKFLDCKIKEKKLHEQEFRENIFGGGIGEKKLLDLLYEAKKLCSLIGGWKFNQFCFVLM